MRELNAGLITYLNQGTKNAAACSVGLNQGTKNAAACSYAARSGAIRPEVRYAKWAGGSRSQTHRRAAKGGFTQDDGNVRGLAPTHTILSFGSSCCSSFVE